MTNAEAIRLEMLKNHQMERKDSQKITSYNNNELMEPRKFRDFLLVSIVFVVYQAASISLFFGVRHKYEKGRGASDLAQWKANYLINCHQELDEKKALYSVVLKGCGYIAFSYGAYIFTLYR